MDTFSNTLFIVLLMGLITAISFFLTGRVRRYCLQNGLIDHPSDRSSHATPTPRGGGLAIVIMVLLCIVALMWFGSLPLNLGGGMLAGCMLVVLVAWIDDHGDVAIRWRGVCYLAAPALSVYLIGGVDVTGLDSGFFASMGFVEDVLIILALSWLINLYNFMDGADGFAAMQSITASLIGGLFFWSSRQYDLALICFAMMASCLGFLFWNWSPARIFMGDVGSCMLGFMFGMLMLAGERTDSVPVSIWCILLALFIWDATLTLLKRLVLGECWYAAHRTFAFHRLMQMGMNHSTLALWALAFNVVILWPMALVAYTMPSLSTYMLIASVVIMMTVWSVIQLVYLKRAPTSHESAG